MKNKLLSILFGGLLSLCCLNAENKGGWPESPRTITPHAIYGGIVGQTFPHADYVEINPKASIIIVSGQGADNANDELFQDSIEEAVEAALSNLEHFLNAAGAGMENIVYIAMAVKEKDDWFSSSKAYNKFFEDRGIKHRPARNTVQAVVDADYRVLFTAQAAVIRTEDPFAQEQTP